MKTPPTHSRFAPFTIPLLAGLLLSVSATFAADEICTSCGQQVSVSGSFAHRKENPSVVIEGAGNNAAAYGEDVNGTNFTVTIAHLPPGKYTITIGAAETSAGAAGERVFDVISGDVSLAKDFDLFAAAGGARKVGDVESFQWINLMRGDTMFMSLTNHRYLATKPSEPGPVTATVTGPSPARKQGECFKWQIVK